MNKNKHHIRIKPTKKTFDFKGSMKRIAEQFMTAERYLTPLIKAESMAPNTAAVLIAMHGDALISGNLKDHSMTEKQIVEATHTFIYLWKTGLFIPSPEFPYTLEQMLEE